MADVLRLKSWRTFMLDGRSSATYGCASKKEVAVAVVLGYEPLKIEREGQAVNVDDVILDIAEHIKRRRAKNTRKSK